MFVNQRYNEVKAGTLSKSDFITEALRDSRVKKLLSQLNTFDEAVYILKEKGYIQEDVIKKPASTFSINNWLKESIGDEIIAPKGEPDDAHVNAFEFEKGWRYELRKMGKYDDDALLKARSAAVKHLEKDALYYTKLELGEYAGDDKGHKDIDISKGKNLKDPDNQMQKVKPRKDSPDKSYVEQKDKEGRTPKILKESADPYQITDLSDIITPEEIKLIGYVYPSQWKADKNNEHKPKADSLTKNFISKAAERLKSNPSDTERAFGKFEREVGIPHKIGSYGSDGLKVLQGDLRYEMEPLIKKAKDEELNGVNKVRNLIRLIVDKPSIKDKYKDVLIKGIKDLEAKGTDVTGLKKQVSQIYAIKESALSDVNTTLAALVSKGDISKNKLFQEDKNKDKEERKEKKGAEGDMNAFLGGKKNLSNPKANENKAKDVDRKELAIGVKDEMKEHGISKKEAIKLALDHLTKVDPHYYTKEKAAGLGESVSILKEAIRKIVKAKLLKEYSYVPEPSGHDVDKADLERELKSVDWPPIYKDTDGKETEDPSNRVQGKPSTPWNDTGYVTRITQERVNRIKKLVDNLGQEGVDIYNKYAPDGCRYGEKDSILDAQTYEEVRPQIEQELQDLEDLDPKDLAKMVINGEINPVSIKFKGAGMLLGHAMQEGEKDPDVKKAFMMIADKLKSK